MHGCHFVGLLTVSLSGGDGDHWPRRAFAPPDDVVKLEIHEGFFAEDSNSSVAGLPWRGAAAISTIAFLQVNVGCLRGT